MMYFKKVETSVLFFRRTNSYHVTFRRSQQVSNCLLRLIGIAGWPPVTLENKADQIGPRRGCLLSGDPLFNYLEGKTLTRTNTIWSHMILKRHRWGAQKVRAGIKLHSKSDWDIRMPSVTLEKQRLSAIK